MSDSDENDIWEYKPLKKSKKQATPVADKPVAKKRRTTKKTQPAVKQRLDQRLDRNNDRLQSQSVAKGSCDKAATNVPSQSRPLASTAAPRSEKIDESTIIDVDAADDVSTPIPSYCPACQMPFSMLLVQSQRWHVSECLDTPGDDNEECPEGVRCSSTIPSHYKRYRHAALAHSRASDDTAILSSSWGRRMSHESCSRSCSPVSVSSQDSDLDLFNTLSTPCRPTPIKLGSGPPTPASKPTTNALLLLRSPGPEDFKKKKGWTPVKVPKSTGSASKKSKSKVSTPIKTDCASQALNGGFVRGAESSALSDDGEISYSPLSERPPDLDVNARTQLRRGLFPKSPSENENDNSMVLFGDSVVLFDDFLVPSDDSLSIDFRDQACCATNNARVGAQSDDAVTQVMLVSSSADSHQLLRSTAAAEGSSDGWRTHTLEGADIDSNRTTSFGPRRFQSPQSLVLERLREHISAPNSCSVPHSGSLNERSHHANTETEPTPAAYTEGPSFSQISSSQLSQSSVTPKKGPGKAGASASSLKQTDIGVFFGLKPLKVKEEAEAETPAQRPGFVSRKRTHGRGRRERGSQRRKGGADVVVEASDAEGTTDDVNTQGLEGEGQRGGGGGRGRGGKWQNTLGGTINNVNTQTLEAEGQRGRGGGGRGGGGKRWNRWKADGEPVEPKRCPFYKKIPGTPFVVDAFQYGKVDGITAYFLTHFHSDHYGGLRKNSTFPIYCNKITANLVKAKLKVAQEFVHELPMNTEVTVEGVRVVLLEANHCPGSAMLLLFLPDGQTVLHVGDFRADPSMEKYPELLACRVQTLYLDTTYCSPEYTFPTQREVVNFAASTAFERVTLNPRTLVVCGSYAVGKEKVFQALAEVLGSKVAMSRDKFNTMCCLESEHTRKLITTDWRAAQVHVLPMMQLNFKNLGAYLQRFTGQYDELVAFKPTGWTFSQEVGAVEHIQPQTCGRISIYGIPYSEHSSFLELKRFVQWLRPQKIIPTVNVGQYDSRKAMEKCFREWLAEASRGQR